jgi:hypothetical protein
MPDRKFNLTVGKLSPVLNGWRETTSRRLIDDFAGFAASGVEGQRKCLWPLLAGHPACQLTGANEHVGTPKLVNADGHEHLIVKQKYGQTPTQVALPARPAGMSEDVILGGARFSWLQNLSDDEILRWPEHPPSFPDDVPIARDRIRIELGRVEVPPIWNGAHSEIRRLLRTDAGRQERQRGTSVMFPWEAPRFDSPLGQRQLRILNAIFLGVARAGGKGQVGGGDRLEPRVVVHGSPVAFKLTAVDLETKKTKRDVSSSADPVNRLQLTILNVHGSNPELISWEEGEEAPLETRITDIVVELIATAEINYREACIRRHLWVSEKRDAIRERMAEDTNVSMLRRAPRKTRISTALPVARRQP